MPVEKMEEVSGRRGRRACGEDGLRTLRRVWMVLRNLCSVAAGLLRRCMVLSWPSQVGGGEKMMERAMALMYRSWLSFLFIRVVVV